MQAALLDGRADVAVHSAKDMPAVSPPELTLGAVPLRANPHDVLVGSRLNELAAGARIGTGSVRRRAQLAALRPDLVFDELRGNIATRLNRLADFDAIVEPVPEPSQNDAEKADNSVGLIRGNFRGIAIGLG